MTNLLSWIKEHKLAVLLFVVIAFLLANDVSGSRRVLQFESARPSAVARPSIGAAPQMADMKIEAEVGRGMDSVATSIMPYPNPVPPVDSSARMVVRTTSLSLKVNNVEEAINRIEQAATSLGGYMVNSDISTPEGASSGSIVLRVPSDKMSEAIEQFKAAGVKTVMQSVSGSDVTDQFVDNAERLRILEANKAKFERIMTDATRVEDMLSVQRELLNLQAQIDAIKGQQQYLEQTSKLSLVSIYLSTDELALPYSPDTAFRPGVIVKEAARSLILTLRGFLTLLIWIVVYAPVWIGGILIFAVFSRLISHHYGKQT